MKARAQLALESLGDVELAKLCADRNEAALRHVITANNQRLFRAAWSILKDRSEAEEAVQATYLNAFRNIGQFSGRSALSTWLTRIAINEAVGRRRSGQRRRKQLESEGVTVLDRYRETLMRGSEPVMPDAMVAREQLRLLLERAVAALPDGFRSVFVLREIEGLSVEETAEALDLPPATVKTRTMRARHKLQKMLAPEVGEALVGAFPFAGADCEKLTERVLSIILKR